MDYVIVMLLVMMVMDLFSERFQIDSEHRVFYDGVRGICMTYSFAETFSQVGFVFL